MLKEPCLFIYGTSKTVHDIYERIQFKQDYQPLVMYHIDVPQYRCSPHAYLKQDIYYLSEIPEKNDYRAGRIAKGQDKDEHAETVIDYLYGVYARIISVACRYKDQYAYKENMNKCSRDQLYDRQDTYLKYDLFDQIAVFKERIGAIGYGFREIKPRNQSGCQIQNIGNLNTACYHLGPCIKDNIKDDPIHNNRYHRLDQRPDKAQIRACIALFKVILGKLPYEVSGLEQFLWYDEYPVVKEAKQKT